MKDQQHTPGPWKAVPDGPLDWAVVSEDYGTVIYRTCYPDEHVDVYVEADAHLIAEAPHLLKACELAIPALEWASTHTHGNRVQFAQALEQLRDAVSAAKQSKIY